MAWIKPSKNYMIVTFARDRTAIDALNEYFSVREGVTIVDLLGMGETLAKKFINTYDIDIAFIEKETLESGQGGLIKEIIIKAETEHNGVITHFVILYDHECFKEMAELGNALLKKKLPVTQFRLDDSEDCEILAQTMHGIINEVEQMEKVRIKILGQELFKLPEQ